MNCRQDRETAQLVVGSVGARLSLGKQSDGQPCDASIENNRRGWGRSPTPARAGLPEGGVSTNLDYPRKVQRLSCATVVCQRLTFQPAPEWLGPLKHLGKPRGAGYGGNHPAGPGTNVDVGGITLVEGTQGSHALPITVSPQGSTGGHSMTAAGTVVGAKSAPRRNKLHR